MEKCINNKRLKIALVLLILIRLLVFILNKQCDLYILIFGVNQWIINLFVNISIIITTKLILNHSVKNTLKHVINFIAVICITLLLFVNIFFNCEKSYFYFHSPDKSRTLVVEEDSFLLSGWSNFYEKKGFIFIKELKEHIYTDDGFRPFSSNAYKLKWLDDNSVELNYDIGSGSIEYQTKILKIH